MSNRKYQSKKLDKYERDAKYKRRLARIADNIKLSPSGAYRVGYNGSITGEPNDTKYIKRFYRNNCSTILKKISNKKVRRYNGYIPNNSGYRKVFDFGRNYNE